MSTKHNVDAKRTLWRYRRSDVYDKSFTTNSHCSPDQTMAKTENGSRMSQRPKNFIGERLQNPGVLFVAPCILFYEIMLTGVNEGHDKWNGLDISFALQRNTILW